MSAIKVLVVEDEPLIAKDIKKHLGQINYTVIGIAYSSERALDYLHSYHPDIVLLDINIKGSMDGIQIAEIINDRYKIPFVYLTSYSDQATLQRAKPTLPSGYVLKPFDEKDLLTSIETAIYNYAHLRTGQIPTFEKANEQLEQALTAKEYEILLDLCDGLINQQIAEKHFISINTVKSHIKNIYLKLETNNRAATISKLISLR